MNDSPGVGHINLLSHVLLPVAHPDDAKLSARALKPYEPDRVTALHVVEKGEGVPDKTPVEQSEEIASESFEMIKDIFPDAQFERVYGRNIIDSIFTVAEDADVSAIAFRSRGGNRLMHFLSGDLSLKLVTQADRPIIALPRINDP